MSQRTFSREACHSGLTSERSLPYNRRVSWYDGALATRIPSFIVSALSVTSTRLPDERRDSFFVFAFLRFTCLRPINVCPTTAGITKHVSDTRRRRSDVRRCRHSRVLAWVIWLYMSWYPPGVDAGSTTVLALLDSLKERSTSRYWLNSTTLFTSPMFMPTACKLLIWSTIPLAISRR